MEHATTFWGGITVTQDGYASLTQLKRPKLLSVFRMVKDGFGNYKP